MNTLRYRILFFFGVYGNVFRANETASIEEPCHPDVDDESLWHDNTPSWVDYNRKPIKAESCVLHNSVSQFNGTLEGTIPIDCGKFTVFDVDIKAFSKKQNCWGLTPELLFSRQECFWKSTCRLQYSRSFIIWTAPTQMHCYGRVPDSLTLSYKCLDTEKLSIHDVIKHSQDVTSERGLVRAHAYCDGAEKTYPREDYSGNHILTVRPNFAASETSFVLVRVLQLHTCQEDDELTISDDVKKCNPIWEEGKTYKLYGDKFKVALRMNGVNGRSSSPTCENCTLLCYQWFKADSPKVMKKFEKTVRKCERRTDIQILDVMQEVSSHATNGVLRSHSTFPWNYPRPRPLYASSRFFGEMFSTYTHWLHKPHNMRDPWLRIQAEKFALARNDFLTIPGICQINSTNKICDLTGHAINVTLRIRHSRLPSDSGFVLCYEWSPKSSQPSESPCSQFVHQSEGCKKKPKNQVPDERRKKHPKRHKKKGKNKSKSSAGRPKKKRKGNQ